MGTDNRASPGHRLILSETAFCHVGMGGSVGFADQAQGPSFGYTMNRIGGQPSAERARPVDAAYRKQGLTSDCSGDWR